MTEEEVAEYNRLCDRYNYLVAENSNLEAEIELGVSNCYVVGENITQMGRTVTGNVEYVAGETDDAMVVCNNLNHALDELIRNYFLFKNMSEASKMLTKCNDEYFTRFHFYNELRRITLGYVIGLDSNVVDNERLRKKVEKAYLANTDYWLAYAITAVQLWASNEKEAAYRALGKAMSMDCYKTCVFFMLVNIRFERLDTAKNWFLTLLDKTDVNNMSDEWQHVLRTYLSGAMSKDAAFTALAEEHFEKLMAQAEATNADFNRKAVEKSYAYAESFIHLTEEKFPGLYRVTAEYDEMRDLLSSMEKIGAMARHYDEVYQKEETFAENMHEHIENILYTLISAYDDEEGKLMREIALNDAIMSARGDRDLANKKMKMLYGDEPEQQTFADLMLKWAFAEDYRETDITIKRFALSRLKERIVKGFADYFEKRYATLKDKYTLRVGEETSIPSCIVTCGENDYDKAADVVRKHYDKHKREFIMSDKYFKIFLLLCFGAVALLGIAALAIKTAAFPVLLTLGIVLGVVSGFLTWRRCVDLGKEIAERCRLALVQLRKALDDMGDWRKKVKQHYETLEDLNSAIDRF